MTEPWQPPGAPAQVADPEGAEPATTGTDVALVRDGQVHTVQTVVDG